MGAAWRVARSASVRPPSPFSAWTTQTGTPDAASCGGEVSVFGDVVEVLDARPDRIAGPVLLEVLDQLRLCALGVLADLAIRGISRSRMAIGQLPIFWDARITARKNPASSSVVKLMPRSTTGPWK